MFSSLPGSHNKSDKNFAENEHFLKKRKSDGNGDDNVPWLITFADLMTILLVFSFFLFITNHQNDQNPVNKKNASDRLQSLIPLANANTRNHTADQSVKLYIPAEALKVEQPRDEEKTIRKKLIFFPSNKSALSPGFKSDLAELAETAKKNPSSKIILTSYTDGKSDLSANRVNCIVAYFSKECGIEKKKIFLQNFPEKIPQPADTSTDEIMPAERLVEVRLIKAFWWF